MATLVFNPEASPAVTACDGAVAINVGATTWATIHDDVFAPYFVSNAIAESLILDGSPGAWTDMSRIELNFDTSAIGGLPVGSVITGAILQAYCEAYAFTFPVDKGVAVCSVTPGMPSIVMPTDYPLFGVVRFCDTDVAFSTMVFGAYQSWTLNAAGLAALNPAGVTSLGLRISSDIDDSEPANGGLARVDYTMADAGVNPPVLTVYYLAPTVDGGKKMFVLSVKALRFTGV